MRVVVPDFLSLDAIIGAKYLCVNAVGNVSNMIQTRKKSELITYQSVSYQALLLSYTIHKTYTCSTNAHMR